MQASGITVSANKVGFILLVLFFRVVLDCSYAFFVSDIFAYDGYGFEFDLSSYVLSWGIYVISIGMLSDRLKNVGHYFYVTAVLSVVAPLSTICGLDASRPFFPLIVTVLALYWVFFLSNTPLVSFRRLPVVKQGRSFAIVISILFVVFLVFWFSISGAKVNFDLSKVYEYREANAELAAQGILAYTNNWTFQVFSIYLICFALYFRRYLIFCMLVIVQGFFFGVSAHKSVLFLPLLVVSVWFYFRRSDSLLIIPAAFVFLILLSMFTFLVFDDLWLTSLLSRRVFFMPASLSFAYFEFFSTNAHAYWANSVMSGFFVYPYGDVGIPYVIGDYLGYPQMGANNGFVSSGFAHAGTFGVFFYATLIGLLLRVINDISQGLMPVWVAVAISVVPLRSLLISSDLFTVMLTHGFAVAICLIYLSRQRAPTLT